MGCLLCEWTWIFSVRLCRCSVLEETMTAGKVSLMLGVVSEFLVSGGGCSASGVFVMCSCA